MLFINTKSEDSFFIAIKYYFQTEVLVNPVYKIQNHHISNIIIRSPHTVRLTSLISVIHHDH